MILVVFGTIEPNEVGLTGTTSRICSPHYWGLFWNAKKNQNLLLKITLVPTLPWRY